MCLISNTECAESSVESFSMIDYDVVNFMAASCVMCVLGVGGEELSSCTGYGVVWFRI